jgi:hypothetical protein
MINFDYLYLAISKIDKSLKKIKEIEIDIALDFTY